MVSLNFSDLALSQSMEVSLQKAMANMEEEKTFMAPSFVVISLPTQKKLKKRRVRSHYYRKIKKIAAKSSAGFSTRKNK